MNFELRGTLGKITDGMRARMPKWGVRSNVNLKSAEVLEKKAEDGEQIGFLLQKRGWTLIQGYLAERKRAIEMFFESSSIVSQEKALEFSKMQGRKAELRLFEEWIELSVKRGVEAAKELAEKGQKRKEQ